MHGMLLDIFGKHWPEINVVDAPIFMEREMRNWL